MRHWWQLATRNWRTKPARSGLAALAVAFGVAVVVWVTCCYESVRRSVTELVLEWIGRAHVIVEPVEGRWALFDADLEPRLAALPQVARTVARTREFVEAAVARPPSAGESSESDNATTPDAAVPQPRSRSDAPVEPGDDSPGSESKQPVTQDDPSRRNHAAAKPGDDSPGSESKQPVTKHDPSRRNHAAAKPGDDSPGSESKQPVTKHDPSRRSDAAVEPEWPGSGLIGGGVPTGRANFGSNPPPKRGPPDEKFIAIEAAGIVPGREAEFRTYPIVEGRMLSPDDRDAVVAERLLAEAWGFGVGDVLWVRHIVPPAEARPFKVVGLLDRRRASANQPPMIWLTLTDVQSVCRFPDRVKSIDVILKDGSVNGIAAASEAIRRVIDERNAERAAAGKPEESLKLTTTEAQHKRLGAARGLLQFIMMLLACVVLATAFFIILATMSMGLHERVGELGLLRCVGLTRRQLATQVLLETMPLGVAGVLFGVPLGFLLQWLTIQAVPEYIGHMAVSVWGVALAVLGGLGTTLLGAAAPAWQALSVSPVEATRPLARGPARGATWLAAALGLALVGGHELVKRRMVDAQAESFDLLAIASLLLLYGGFALLAPALVALLGRLAVRVAASGLRLRGELLGEEIDKAPFRAAALCSGLMVGLSMIVGLIVWGRSVKESWQFPKEFPEAILYAYSKVPLDSARQLADLDGIAEFSAADDFEFSLRKPQPSSLLEAFKSVLDKTSRFIAIDPDTAFDVIQLTYVEGERRDAEARLRQGGHLLVTREFAQARDKHVGDKLSVWAEGKKATFRIAGVIASPGLDIAISFFNATDYYQFYSVGAIVGTLDDARRLFGRHSATLLFFNFDLPDDDEARRRADPGIFAATKPAEDAPTMALGAGPVPGDGPEEQVVNRMLARLGYPPKAFVTARQLKRHIDRSIDNVTLLLSAIPVVGLILAALGVANLMTANVASRSRQIALLRSLGTTRGQVARIVIGEALVLGLLGSVSGLALGMYLGHASNFMTEVLTGFRPAMSVPWGRVCLGAALATLLCLLAGLAPARYASRSNIVGVLTGG